MSFADDLKTFIEGRLTAYDAAIDLGPGSPAQVQIVQPIVDKLGEDPFDTDIATFIRDRMVQEFPELAADNAGLLEDMFTKPLQMLLEPIKREILRVRNNQSVQDLELLAETEADALAANWFANRNVGSVVTGTVRLYWAAPTTVRVTTDKVLTTASGLNFFPSQNYSITSTQMVFNREGSLYYMDIVVTAEQAGDQYNVKKGEITEIQDVPAVVKVANLADFGGGRPAQTNTEFIGGLEQSLTERSLVTKRGITTRITQLFDSVRTLQVVGAGEPGMDRDVLKGTGEGAVHLVSATAVLYGNWLWLSDIIFKENGPNNNVTVQVGDTVRFQKDGAGPEFVVFTATIAHVIPSTGTEQYLLILDQVIGGLPSDEPVDGQAVVLKAGYITISEVPGGMAADVTVPDGQVHLGGHVDIFVRPVSDDEAQASLQNVTDEVPVVAATNFTVSLPNIIGTSGDTVDFLERGVQIGDVLSIETGTDFAGTYHVLAVAEHQLRVDVVFTSASVDLLRGRIVRTIQVGLNEPRQLKLPFGSQQANDLKTVVGSNLFRFETVSVQDYGAAVGDVIRVLDGPDAGDFIIDSFTTEGVVMTTPATATGSLLRYEIFTKYVGLSFPIVRIKGIEVLDSTGQATGITVPYGDAVDIRPVIGLEGAGTVFEVFDSSLIVWPDFSSYGGADTPHAPAAGYDTRYSQKIATADGVVKNVAFDATNDIIQAEINFPPFLTNGRRDKLLILCNEPDVNFVATGSHRTSPVAEGKVGDSISILDGPNKGQYIIRDLRVLDLWGKTTAVKGHHKVALVQVDPELPSDPIGSAIQLIADFGHETPIAAADLVSGIAWASDWDNASGFWRATLLQRLLDSLGHHGITYTLDELDTLMSSLCTSAYKTGPSSHGDLRLYFIEPVSAEMYFGDNPTLFSDILSLERRYRLDPTMDPAQVFPESESETPPTQWLRDSLCAINGTDAYLALGSGSAYAKRGIRDGDVLEYYPPINCLPGRGAMASSFLCCTQAGSNIVQLILPNTDVEGDITNLTPLAAGQPFFIDSGPDFGAYTILEVLNQISMPGSGLPVVKFRVDQILSHSTLSFPATARFATVTARGGTNRVYSPSSENLFDGITAGVWISLYGVPAGSSSCYQYGSDAAYLGTFLVTSNVTQDTDPGDFHDRYYLALDRSNFPADADPEIYPRGNQEVYWIIHEAPEDMPLDTSRGGKELSSKFVRGRLYAQLPLHAHITIPWTDTPCPIVAISSPDVFVHQIALNSISLAGTYGHKMPYRIIRPGVYRLSSTSMSNNREGALYYMDVPVVGLGPGSDMNISEDIALELQGRSNIAGYTLVVDNLVYSFSTKEKLSIILPPSVLPTGSTPDLDNEIRLSGQTLKITYNEAPLVAELQGMFDSPQDRVLVANDLVRHFLPGYVYLDVSYTGGSQTEVVANDLIKLINSLSPDYTQLTSDAVVTTVKLRGATQVTLPISLVALVHGIDRKIKGIRSKNAIGAGMDPTFNGTFQQTYFIPGPDTSKVTPRPNGEQIYLIRG